MPFDASSARPLSDPSRGASAFDASSATPYESSTLRRVVGDTAVSALKGAISVPESVVGLADILTRGSAGKAAEAAGFRPKDAKGFLDTLYSPEQQLANRKVQDAKGFLGTLGAAVENPSVIAQTAVESVPLMFGGGAYARGLGAVSKLSPVARGAIGEGLVGGGSAAEGIRQQTEDGTLTPAQSALAALSGAGTAAFGAAGGKVAQRLGIADIDTALAGGKVAAGKTGPAAVARRVAEGAASEGLLEELPQSMQEQALQNFALGKPALEGVPEAGALGALVGGVMGGGAAGIARPQAPEPAPAPATTIDPNAGPLSKVAVQVAGGPSILDTMRAANEIEAQRAAQIQADELARQQRVAAGEVRSGAEQAIAEGAFDAEQQAKASAQQQATLQAEALPFERIAPEGFGALAPPVTEKERAAQEARAKEQAKNAFPWANEKAAQKQADKLTEATGQAHEVVAHPKAQGRFAAVPVAEGGAETPNDAGLVGEKINREWTAFAPESGTLGIPRSEMPQVKAEHRGALANFLTARGVTQQKEEVAPDSLLPTQAEFSASKVKKAKEFSGGDRSILISADNHVLDGHHQWMAKRELGEPIKVIRLNAPIRELVNLAHEFPSSETSGGAKPASAAPAAAKPASGGEFNVSDRNDTQLLYLANNGKPGWKEAAQAELTRRGNGNADQAQAGAAGPVLPGSVAPAEVPAAAGANAVAQGAGVPSEEPKPSGVIPPVVRGRVEAGLKRLREVADAIAEAAKLEQRAGSPGRYQADVLANRKQDIDSARKALAQFRQFAPRHGVDADAVIAEMGGEPDLSPSKEAQAWIDSPNTVAAESKPAPVKESLTPKPSQPKPTNLLKLIQQGGGISLARLADITGEANVRKARTPVGLFRKSGMDIDGLAELLQQHGFLTEQDVADVGSGGEQAMDLVRQALAGDRVLSQNDVDTVLEQDAEKQYRDMIRQRATDLGIRHTARKFADVEADVLAADETLDEDLSEFDLARAGAAEASDNVVAFVEDFDAFQAGTKQSTADAMRALGFTEDEINEQARSAAQSARIAEEADAGRTQGRGAGADEARPDSAQAQGEGFQLEAPTPEGLRAQAEAAQQADTETPSKAQADAERDAVPFGLEIQSQPKPQGVQGGMFTPDGRASEGAVADQNPTKEPNSAEFIKTPDGSTDFGEITEDMAQAMRRQAGKIRLTRGVQNKDGTGHGLAHIEARHGEEIRASGFNSIVAFVADAVSHIDAVWKPGQTAQIIAVQSGRKGKVVFLELQMARDEAGDFYRVNSAFPADEKYVERKEKREGWKELWSRDPVSADASGAAGFADQSPNAGETAPTVSPQSNSSLSDAEAAGKIEDVGEKIGGARKDLASTGNAPRKVSKDDRPAWAKRYEVSQIVSSSKPGEEGRWSITDKRDTDFMGRSRQVGRQTFATQEEAEAFVSVAAVGRKHRPVPTREGKFEIWRDITDRKRVKVVDKEFDTREEALAYMAANAVEILETNTTFGEADIPLPPDRARTGPQRRDGNVAGDDFKDTFGLRGVEFGNWNNQDERQALMNDAWDGLMDLADVLGIPPKAIGLNGDLALAFGARGHGLSSARAHYELPRAVINLTKERGAGSLAHEWFHALDHYFGRQDGKASATWKVNKDGTRELDVKGADLDMASGGFLRNNSGVRQEVRDAYQALLTTIFKKAETYVQDTEKADQFTARARDDLAAQLDKLRAELSAQKDPKYYKRNNKPASAEQLAEFDAIAKAMIDGDVAAITTDWRHIQSSKAKIASRWTNDSLEQLSAIYKAVRGRSGFDTTKRDGLFDNLRGYMERYSQRLKMLAEAQSGDEKQRIVPTEFAMNAKELDQGRGKDYWTSPHEMAARAFQGYVEDKIAEQGGMSRFLNYGPANAAILTPWGAKRPFPHGNERQAINEALDKLVGELKTKETDTGVALYSLAQDSILSDIASMRKATTLTVDRLKAAIAARIPSIGGAVDAMLKRGDEGRRGGLVLLDTTNEDQVAKVFSEKTGRTLDEAKRTLNMSASGQVEINIPAGGPNTAVLVNGSSDIAQIPVDVQTRTRGRFLAKPIRLMKGRHFGKNRGYGLAHIEASHGSEIDGDVAEYVVQVIRKASKVFDDGSGRLIVQSVGLPRGTAFVELRDDGSHYSVVTAFNGKPRGTLVWSGRRLHLSLKGSGDTAKAVTTAAEPSESPSASTARGNEAEAPPNPVLETLADQTSTGSVAQSFTDGNGAVQGFFDQRSGLTFLLGPNLTEQTAPAVLLHEIVHSQQRQDIDAKAIEMIERRASVPLTKEARAFLDRVADRMESAGVGGQADESTSYLVEQAVIEGRQAGFSAADGKFMDWVDATLGKRVGQLVRDFIGFVRAWALRNGRPIKNLAVDDLVALAKLGARAAARGDVVTDGEGRGESQFSRSAKSIAPLWEGPEQSKLDDLIYTMQDKHIDTRRVVQEIKRKVGQIDDAFDPYLQEELFHGRSAKGVKDFLDGELRPLLSEMSVRRVGMADLEKYLHARHAEERNVQMAKINPGNPDLQDGGSGMTTADARAHLASIDPQRRKVLEALAAKVDAMNVGTRKLLVDAGLETAETMKAWEATYKNYVPLQREEADDGIGRFGTGQGYSVRGPASKRAMGSTKTVVDILANIAMQRERTIVRAEKNRVAKAQYALALHAPNPDFWMPVNPDEATAFSPAQKAKVAQELASLGLDPSDAENFVNEPKQRYVDPQTGFVSERINPALRGHDNVLALRIDGKDRFVFYNNGDARAQRMVHALKNLDADQMGRLLQVSAKLTRYFASVNTQYNPVFGVINITRDVQSALLNLSTTDLRGSEGAILKDTFSALKGIYSDLRAHRAGKGASSKWASLFEEFQREGGQTGYKDMFATGKERAEAIEAEMKKIAEGKLKSGGRAVFEWLSDYNEALENAVRLAAYKAAKDRGISNQRAASIAKNLTVNFNRKGQVATQAGAMYAFFNAAVQGTTRTLETLAGPAGKKIILGGLTLGALQALTLAAAGFDDDEPPDFVRERSLVFPIGDGKYVSVPMPLGFHVIPSVSRIATEWALSGFKNTPQRVSEFLSLFADTFNPIGNAGLTMQTLAPTALDPIAALAENKDWTGKAIAREDFNSLKPTPGYSRARDTASWMSKTIAYWANLATGGTDYKPGLLSPTPDQLDYLIGQFTGGVGREYLKAEQTVGSALTGEDLPPHKVPLLGRFYGDTKGQSSEAGRFYSNLKTINLHKAELDGRRKNGGDVSGYLSEHPDARLTLFAARTESQVRKLREQRKAALERDVGRDRVKMIDDQITSVMRRLNERAEALSR